MKHPRRYDTDEATSKRMSKVKLKGGDAEVLLAKRLWHLGYRYKLNYKGLPGSPDIAILKHHIAVFVDGEFWHGYDWTNRKVKLKRNREYWIAKIEENMARDARTDKELISAGWIPIHFASKEVLQHIDSCVQAVQELVFDLQMQKYDIGEMCTNL